MQNMLRRWVVVCLLACSGLVPLWAQSDIQLVESVPAETVLGDSATARTLPVWVEMFSSARKTIDIEQFYISNKPHSQLDSVLIVLVKAARHGVRVRIIADGKFYGIYPQMLDSLNTVPNIEVRIIRTYDNLGGVQHSKYFIVDGQQVFLGSQNFDWRALEHIHELGVRIRNARLARLFTRIFETDWKLADGIAPDKAVPLRLPAELQITPAHPVKLQFQGEAVTVFPSFSPKGYFPNGLAFDEATILRLIQNARHQIVIQLLSYNPQHGREYYEALEVALRQAAARGVRVRLLVSNWNLREPGLSYLKSLAVLPNIEVRFTRIPQWSGGFIPFARVEHCKYVVVDTNRVYISTANWAKNYFYASRNLGLTFHSAKMATVVRRIFERSWNSPYAETLDACKSYQPPRIAE